MTFAESLTAKTENDDSSVCPYPRVGFHESLGGGGPKTDVDGRTVRPPSTCQS